MRGSLTQRLPECPSSALSGSQVTQGIINFNSVVVGISEKQLEQMVAGHWGLPVQLPQFQGICPGCPVAKTTQVSIKSKGNRNAEIMRLCFTSWNWYENKDDFLSLGLITY